MQKQTVINLHYWFWEANGKWRLRRPPSQKSEREAFLAEPLGHSDDTKDEGLIRNVTVRVEEPDRRVGP